MPKSRARRARADASGDPNLRRFFLPQTPGPSPQSRPKMADASSPAGDAEQVSLGPPSPSVSAASPVPSPGGIRTPPSSHSQADADSICSAASDRLSRDLNTILQLLPSKADFDALAARVETAVREDIHSLQQTTSALAVRVDAVETEIAAAAPRIRAVEQYQSETLTHLTRLQLQVEDLEDRSRRNNVRIRGLPEATTPSHLRETVAGIFATLLGDAAAADIEIDRVHRALGVRSQDPLRPRDVVCRLHYFTIKEAIIRKAWQQQQIPFDGASLQILPDLSRNTLRRRALLRPLLEQLRAAGASYRWGFPFHLIVRKEDRSFTVRSLPDVAPLLAFLRLDPITLPDWTLPMPDGAPPGVQVPLRARGSVGRSLRAPRHVRPEA